MSVADRTKALIADTDTEALRARLVATVFGDRIGLALFLGALCVLFTFTRVGIFITDTLTTANAFVALTEGHLAVTEPFYGTNLDTPGMFVVDGNHYGRNYGQLVASLPAYVLLRAVGVVADLRIALVGGWSLGLLALSVVTGRVLDQPRVFAIGGSGAALALFGLNVAVATPLPARMVPILALQLTSIVAGALLAVVVYRLLRYLASQRVGLVAGVLVILATPIGFWAPIPKRHVVTTLIAFVAFLAFAKSRSNDQPRRTVFHAGAYVMAGFLAWIHAPEAFVLLITLLVADIVSSPPERLRALPVVAGAFVVSLIPFFVTNYLLTGNPIYPPRFQTGFGVDLPAEQLRDNPGGEDPSAEDGGGGGGGDGGGGGGGTGTDGPERIILPFIGDLLSPFLTFNNRLKLGLETVWYNTEQITRTFLRSGYVSTNPSAQGEAINLSMLESSPLLGALVSPLVHVVESRPEIRSIGKRLRRPGGATAFALALYTVLFTLLYIPQLPIHAQVTVRYLLPVYAVGVVGVVWCPPIRRALERHLRTFAWVTAGSVLVGGQLLVVTFVALELALGEAFQFYALLGLLLAGAIAVSSFLTVLTDRADRLLVATIGVTTAAVTVFSLLVVTAYASSIGTYPSGGEQLLPIVRVLADLLSPL